MRVAIYQDYVHNNGSLAMALQDRGIHYAFFDAEMIISGALTMVDALIMPGGADLYYCEKLNGPGNLEIRDFVAKGGGYLGLCAGAYYGCSALDWNKGEIAGPRELAFINATASGPILDFIEDRDIEKSWYGAAPLTWGNKTFNTLYAAGPLFHNLKDDVRVYASYAQGPAVIGKGKVILSSPHIEICGDYFAFGRYQHNAKNAAHDARVGEIISRDGDTQNAFFNFILGELER
jgi:glutamine amidotransferase-like uncharacterized protein